MGLNVIDYGIIIAYLLGMVAIGFYSMHFTNTKEDFLVAGRRLGFFMFFGCMVAVALGGGATLGSAKLGYKWGVSGLWLDGSFCLGLVTLGIFVSSKLAKLRALSLPEVTEMNYGKWARIFSAVLTIIYTAGISTVNVIAMGSLLGGTMGWTPQMAMLVGGGIVVFYTIVGGMWAVSMTDIVQFIIKAIGVLILAPIFGISAVGGWDTFVANTPAPKLEVMAMGWDNALMYFLMFVPGTVIGQDMWQRVFTARSKDIARTGTITAGIFTFFYGCSTVVIGMCVFQLFPNLSNPQDALVVGVINFLPTGLRGFVLAAALCATMSAASGTMLASSTIIYNDFYQRFINPNADESKAVWVNKVIALGVGSVVMLCAFYINDVLDAMDLAYAYLTGCIFVPVLASFVLRRFSPKAGLVALAVSAVAVTASFINFGISSSYPIIIGMTVGLIVYGIVNIMDKNKIDAPMDKVGTEDKLFSETTIIHH